MRALLVAVLAMALVGCAAVHDPETGGTRKSTAAKISTKGTKPVALRRTKAVAKVTPAKATTSAAVVDSVTDKAKAAIAAMLDNPTSAEFYNVRRAQKDLLHRRVDAICGQVRVKSGSGRGGMPFLYIVGHDRDDEAYLVNGSHVAETVHRAVCR